MIRSLVFAVGHLCTFLLACSQLGQWSIWLDQINHFLLLVLPITFIFAVIKLFYVIFDKGKKLWAPIAWLSILLLVVCRNVAPELKRSSHRAEQAPTSFKVVTANVFGKHVKPSDFVQWIKSESPDVILLAEATRDLVERLKHDYPYHADCIEDDYMCSTLVMSRQPVLESRGLANGDADNRKALSAVAMDVCIDEYKVSFLGVHLARPLPAATQIRDIRLLLPHVHAMREHNMVLLGDFNLTPWSFALKRLDKAFRLRRITRAMSTWPSKTGYPFMGIDHIYLSDGLLEGKVYTGPTHNSDHRPVVAEISLSSESAPNPECAKASIAHSEP